MKWVYFKNLKTDYFFQILNNQLNMLSYPVILRSCRSYPKHIYKFKKKRLLIIQDFSPFTHLYDNNPLYFSKVLSNNYWQKWDEF